jgi:hypothetical protein
MRSRLRALAATTAKLIDEALELLEHAKSAGDRRTELAALREAHDGVALLMKVAGVLVGDGQITVSVNQRRLAYTQLSRLPEEFIRRVCARDADAIDAVVTALGKPSEPEDGKETPFRDSESLTAS